MIFSIFDNIDSEIFFIYGLIALVVVLIIIIVIIDKLDSKKKRKSLSDTLSLKPIEDPANFKNQKVEVVKINDKVEKEDEFKNVTTIPEIKVDNPVYEDEIVEDDSDRYVDVDSYYDREEVYQDEEDEYVEDELEKTQAQIRVEEITKALKDANVDEKIEKDRYAKFEEEQEKNAIISYKELKEEYDRLYEENEKTQYLEDNEIPININELYELNKKEEEKIERHVEEAKEYEKDNYKNYNLDEDIL